MRKFIHCGFELSLPLTCGWGSKQFVSLISYISCSSWSYIFVISCKHFSRRGFTSNGLYSAVEVPLKIFQTAAILEVLYTTVYLRSEKEVSSDKKWRHNWIICSFPFKFVDFPLCSWWVLGTQIWMREWEGGGGGKEGKERESFSLFVFLSVFIGS